MEKSKGNEIEVEMCEANCEWDENWKSSFNKNSLWCLGGMDFVENQKGWSFQVFRRNCKMETKVETK